VSGLKGGITVTTSQTRIVREEDCAPAAPIVWRHAVKLFPVPEYKYLSLAHISLFLSLSFFPDYLLVTNHCKYGIHQSYLVSYPAQLVSIQFMSKQKSAETSQHCIPTPACTCV
jgi:hypothetical protein